LIINDGLIQMNGGNGQNEVVDILTSVTLTGGGTITLATIPTNGGDAFLEGNGKTLTNTNNTIQGTGVIGNGNLLLTNNSVIDATPEGGSSTLSLNGGNITNSDLLEATAGGTLAIATNVTNTGANITATGSLSLVTVSSSAITGGTLNTANGGAIETTAAATLQGLTISAGSTYTSLDGVTTTLLGTIDNLGSIEQIGGNGTNGVHHYRRCGHADRRRNRDVGRDHKQRRQRVCRRQWPDADQYEQHHPGHRCHRQRQCGADQ
jgi:hypothetical protein